MRVQRPTETEMRMIAGIQMGAQRLTETEIRMIAAMQMRAEIRNGSRSIDQNS